MTAQPIPAEAVVKQERAHEGISAAFEEQSGVLLLAGMTTQVVPAPALPPLPDDPDDPEPEEPELPLPAAVVVGVEPPLPPEDAGQVPPVVPEFTHVQTAAVEDWTARI